MVANVITAPPPVTSGIVETSIPARLDRLPWGAFHSLVVVALGITWVLDGLEVTLAGAVAPALKESSVLHFTNADVGIASSGYLAGAVLGALLFGWLTDRLGRKKLFFITLAVYLVATAATAFSWNLWSFVLFRFLTGAGIGGEYTAVNSTIQELIPARYRGWTDLLINGSFWIGAAVGAAGSIVLLDPALLPPEYGWRLAFFIGATLGLVIFLMRFWLPESPRWLMTHGYADAAERVVAGIESRVHATDLPRGLPVIRLRVRRFTPISAVLHTLFQVHRRRTFVGLALMGAQAFFYNAIFFTYALVLSDFYGIEADRVGWYLLPFAAGNFLGPMLPPVRYHRAPPHDRVYLRDFRSAPGCGRIFVCDRRAFGSRPNHRLDDHILFCVRCRRFGLFDRKRNIPAGNPRARHCLLLCDWHGNWRHPGSVGFRRPHRQRLALGAFCRVSSWLDSYDPRRAGCRALGSCRRAPAARIGGTPACRG
jgi:MFS family permease